MSNYLEAQPKPIRFTHPVTWILIGINVAVWVAINLTGGSHSHLIPQLALIPEFGLRQQWVTSAFTHVDTVHLLLNMISLYFIGPALETFFGASKYMLIYLISMLGASAMVVLLSNPYAATIGASGCIFGLLGTYFTLALRYKQDMRGILFWLGVNLLFTFSNPDISWQGHIGGLLAGILISLLLTKSTKQSFRG